MYSRISFYSGLRRGIWWCNDKGSLLFFPTDKLSPELQQEGEQLNTPSDLREVLSPRSYHISPKRWRWSKTVGFKWRSSSFHSLESELQRAVYSCIDYCLKESIGNPVEILRCAQRFLLCGRPLDVTDPSAPLNGETNFILVKRRNVFQSAKEEFQSVSVVTNPGCWCIISKQCLFFSVQSIEIVTVRYKERCF